ncbi:MAG: ABC transporter ATP-binding protein [Bryobacteraceae bacterium]
MIDCKHLTKRFGDSVAVDDVTFQVPGGVCVLLGHNGAGKSTLLRMMAGLLAPDEGEVRILNLDSTRKPLALRRQIGVVPEDLGLFDSLTVQEHLELCGPVYGLNRNEIRERTASLLGMLGIEKDRNTFLDRCSHGVRKKTAFAMALLHNPRVLLLDEPFEGIDPVSSIAIQNLLAAISQRGITVFFTSHILPVVSRLATDIIVIREGRVVLAAAVARISRPLDDLYFELAGAPATKDLTGDLPWLRSSPS